MVVNLEYADIIAENSLVLVTDSRKKIIWASESLLVLLGYRFDEIYGRSPKMFRSLTYNTRIFKEMDNTISASGIWSGIIKNSSKSGTDILCHAKITSKDDKYIAMYTDLSNILGNDKLNIYDESVFRKMTGAADLKVICLCSSNVPNLISVSEGILTMLSIDLNAALSKKNILELFNISDSFGTMQMFVEHFKRSEETTLELNILGKIKYFKIRIDPFLYMGDDAHIFTLVDVTDIININKQMRKMNNAKNLFFANFSHEIKNPLNAMIGFLELLKDSERDFIQREYFDIVMENSKYILELINDTIDFASLDNGEFDIIEREFSYKDIQSTIEVFYAKSLSKNIDFSVYISPYLPSKMKQDIIRIRQIISNLLSNSMKFTSVGGKISISINYVDSKLRIIITDNGIGMTSEQLKKVFNPYVQADANTMINFGGTGLGLAIVDQIIKKMQGHMQVKSELGVGTEFIIDIPIEVTKEKEFDGLLNIEELFIFVPSFSSDKLQTITDYMLQFTGGKIKFIIVKNINELKELVDKFIIVFYDDIYVEYINFFNNNKCVLIKKMNVVLDKTMDKSNVVEISLPILGSKLYNAFSSFFKSDNKNSIQKMYISGKIMVVDDIDVNLLLFERIFNALHVDIHTQKNSMYGFDDYVQSIIGNKSSFDLIFLDENMPGITGSELAKKILLYEDKFSIIHTPIISITANQNVSEKNIFDAILSKPIDKQSLIRLALKFLNHGSSEDPNQKIAFKRNKLKQLKKVFETDLENIRYFISKIQMFFDPSEQEELNKITPKTTNAEFKNIYNNIIKKFRMK